MAVIPSVTCTHCEKKFKPKTDVQGKKIKCPFCKETIAVPAAKGVKPAKVKAAVEEAVPLVESAPAVVAAAPEPPQEEAEDLDGSPNPYGVQTQDLAVRCPNCANEMKSAKSVICLHCGYNTLTRAVGKTEKTLALTFQQHLLHLLPAIGAGLFAFFSIVFLLYYAVVSPHHVVGTMFEFTDAESLRMWTTLIFLSWIWGAGMYCFKRFIEKPKPDEIKTST